MSLIAIAAIVVYLIGAPIGYQYVKVCYEGKYDQFTNDDKYFAVFVGIWSWIGIVSFALAWEMAHKK